MLHALAADGRSYAERADLAADLAHPLPPAAGPVEDDAGAVVVPDEVPAWMQGLIP